MAKRKFHLTEEEVKGFRAHEARTRDVRELKRLQGVRLYGTGSSIASVEQIVGCAESTLREWVREYERNGLAALASGYAGSARNASKLTEEQVKDLRQRLHEETPQALLRGEAQDASSHFWTVSALQVAVEQWYGVRFRDVSSYRRLLHRCGLSYQRTEQVYKSRPNAAQMAAFEAELEKK